MPFGGFRGKSLAALDAPRGRLEGPPPEGINRILARCGVAPWRPSGLFLAASGAGSW